MYRYFIISNQEVAYTSKIEYNTFNEALNAGLDHLEA